MYHRIFFHTFVCFAFLFATSCISYHTLPKDDALLSAHNRIYSQEQKGLSIATEGYYTKEKCLRFFQRDLLALGYIPIYVSVSNRGENEFTIRRMNVVFQFEDGMEATMAPVQEVIENAYFSKVPAILALPFAIVPGIALWINRDRANDKLDQDYSEKAFRDLHIRPGDKISGFMFFRIPVGPGWKVDRKLVQDGSVEMIIDKKATADEMAEAFNYVLSINEDF